MGSLLLWKSEIYSITLSTLTAALVVALSLPVGYLTVRRPGALTNIIEKMCFTGFALPSIAVSLSLVFFGARIGPPLYQSILLLVIACAVLYMPTGLGAIRSSMTQISPRYEESSMTLGKNKIKSAILTNLPLMKSGILSLIHIWRCRRLLTCRSRWSPYH